MKNLLQWKVEALNLSAVLITLADIELWLKVLILGATLVYTILKIMDLWNRLNKKD